MYLKQPDAKRNKNNNKKQKRLEASHEMIFQ